LAAYATTPRHAAQGNPKAPETARAAGAIFNPAGPGPQKKKKKKVRTAAIGEFTHVGIRIELKKTALDNREHHL